MQLHLQQHVLRIANGENNSINTGHVTVQAVKVVSNFQQNILRVTDIHISTHL